MPKFLSELSEEQRQKWFVDNLRRHDELAAKAKYKCFVCGVPLTKGLPKGLESINLECDICFHMLKSEFVSSSKLSYPREMLHSVKDEWLAMQYGVPWDECEQDALPFLQQGRIPTSLPTPDQMETLVTRVDALERICELLQPSVDWSEYIFQYVANLHHRPTYLGLTYWEWDLGLRVLENLAANESASRFIAELRKMERREQ